MVKDSVNDHVQLQVLICTYGKEGLQRIAAASHPIVEGVEYLVSWQTEGRNDLPEAIKCRDDFKIFTSDTKGLSINRNIALSKATAPILLISDDDVDYTEDGLKTVIDSFRENANTDIICFKYESASTHKFYPNESISLSHPSKGYFVSSIEIAFRRESVQGKIRFNENFGIGAIFPSGEEDIFLSDCLDFGLNGIFIPETIARHDSVTTSERNLILASRPQTKGAVFLKLHPNDWPLRMIIHAIREIPLWRKGLVPSPISYCFNWLKGVKKAKHAKVFPTTKDSNHE